MKKIRTPPKKRLSTKALITAALVAAVLSLLGSSVSVTIDRINVEITMFRFR